MLLRLRIQSAEQSQNESLVAESHKSKTLPSLPEPSIEGSYDCKIIYASHLASHRSDIACFVFDTTYMVLGDPSTTIK